MNLSERITSAMENKGWKQSDLSRATGISTALISKIITGKIQDPQLRTMMTIAHALDVDMNYLSGWDEK